ncbi:MAG: MMPL family transporter [Arenicellales bacterium]
MAEDSHDNAQSRLVTVVTGAFMRWYWLILAAALVSGYYSFQVARHLELNTDLVALMPAGVPSVENLQKVIRKTGGYSSAMVIVKSPDPEAAVRFLSDLRKEVLRLDYISSAEYEEDTSIFHRNQLLYVDEKDLEEILKRLTARIEYEKQHINFDVKDTSVSIKIRGADKQPPSLDFSDIEKKYRGSSQDKSNEKKIFRNEAGNITIMVVLPKGSTTSVKYARKVTEGLQSLVDKLDPKKYNPDMTVAIGGRVASRVAEFDVVISDLTSSAGWSIGGILLIIVLFYRRFSSLVYICFPLAVSFLWTFALTRMVLGGLNLITVFLVLILFGLGIDYGIHNLQRYDEVRARGGDIREALATIVFKTGHAALLAAATTAVGFYALMLTDFRAFSEFGFIAGTGVTLAFFAMYTVFPALIVLAERLGLYRPPRPLRIRKIVGSWRLDLSKPVLIVGLVLTVASTIAAFEISFEQDFGKLDTEIPRMKVLRDEVREVFPLRSDKAVLYVDNLEDVRAVVAKLEEIRRSRSPKNATIEKVKSIYDVVPDTEEQRRRLKIIDKIHARMVEAIHLLEDFGAKDSSRDTKRKEELQRLLKYAGIQELKPTQLPPAIQRIYTGVKGSKGYLVYIYNARSTAQLHNAEAFVNDIRTIKANGKTYHPATEAMVFVDMLNLMRSDAKHAVAVVLVSVFIVLLLAYRSIRSSLIVMIPVVIGLSWMLGIMAAFGIKLNVINMVVLPTVLGIGIDNGIHLFQRYGEEGYSNIRSVVSTTGGAAFLTTATTLLGFAGTLAAQNNGLRSLGLAATIGLTTCLVSSLTVFPALLSRCGKRLIGMRLTGRHDTGPRDS